MTTQLSLGYRDQTGWGGERTRERDGRQGRTGTRAPAIKTLPPWGSGRDPGSLNLAGLVPRQEGEWQRGHCPDAHGDSASLYRVLSLRDVASFLHSFCGTF